MSPSPSPVAPGYAPKSVARCRPAAPTRSRLASTRQRHAPTPSQAASTSTHDEHEGHGARRSALIDAYQLTWTYRSPSGAGAVGTAVPTVHDHSPSGRTSVIAAARIADSPGVRATVASRSESAGA